MGLKLNGSSSGSVELNAPADTTSGADVTLTLPVNDGDANQFLQTDGSGALSFAVPANLGTAATASGTNLQFNSGYGSVATAYGVRAFVVFDGASPGSPDLTRNVSTVGDNGTGRFTINFTNNMPDANYVYAGGAGNATGTTTAGRSITRDGEFTTSAAPIRVGHTNSTGIDDDYIGVMFLR